MREVEPDLVLINLETDIKPSSPPTLYTLLIHVHFTLCTSHSALNTLHSTALYTSPTHVAAKRIPPIQSIGT